jgi:hypothetical protein
VKGAWFSLVAQGEGLSELRAPCTQMARMVLKNFAQSTFLTSGLGKRVTLRLAGRDCLLCAFA